MASSSNSPCAACKLQRRKCTQGCVFAPYFPPDNPQKFANVHRVFGGSNVAKLLTELPHPHREEAVNSLGFEADARLRDPVYGCVGHISILQQKLKIVHDELAVARKELSAYIGAAAYGPFLPPYQSPFAVAASPFHPAPPQHHHLMHGASTSPMPPVHGGMGMGLGLMPAGTPQAVQQQQQQQLAMAAAVAAREQEILRSLEQQQLQQNNNEMGSRGLLFNHQELGSNGDGGGGMVVVTASGGGVASPPSGLALVSPSTVVQEQFENPFHIHHQQQQHNLQLEQYLQQHQRTGSDQRAVSEEGGVASAVHHLEI